MQPFIFEKSRHKKQCIQMQSRCKSVTTCYRHSVHLFSACRCQAALFASGMIRRWCLIKSRSVCLCAHTTSTAHSYISGYDYYQHKLVKNRVQQHKQASQQNSQDEYPVRKRDQWPANTCKIVKYILQADVLPSLLG